MKYVRKIDSIMVPLTFLCGALLIGLFFLLPAKSLDGEIKQHTIKPWKNIAHTAVIKIDLNPFYSIPDDRRSKSSLKLYEGNIQIVPSNIPSSRIANGEMGLFHRDKGKSAHQLYFFVGLNTETNKNQYSYTAVAYPDHKLFFYGIFILAVSYLISSLCCKKTRPVFCFRNIISVSAFILLICAVLISNVTEPLKVCGDARQNISVGLNLSQLGDYKDGSINSSDEPYLRREPVYPIFIALLDNIRSPDNYSIQCVKSCKFPSNEDCGKQVAEIRKANLVFMAVAMFAAWWLVITITSSSVAGIGIIFLIGFSYTLQAAANSTLTELHASTFMVLIACCLVIVIQTPKYIILFLLGVLTGVLALVKVIFAPFILVLMVFISVLLKANYSWASILKFMFVMFAGYTLLVGSWITRNYIVADTFKIVEKRSVGVMHVRASYNLMNMDEYWAGFIYYTPYLKSKINKSELHEFPYMRFNTKDENGFRRSAQIKYRERLKEIAGNKGNENSSNVDKKAVYTADELSRVSNEAKSAILSNPIKHMIVMPLLAYRAVYIERGIGFVRSKDLHEDNAMQLSLSGTGIKFSSIESTVFNFVGALSLILAPIFGLMYWRSWLPLMIALPALYNHFIYSLSSHFIPRYAYPEIPLRYICLVIVIYCCVAWIFKFCKLSLKSTAILK